jgi:hypothetical protein
MSVSKSDWSIVEFSRKIDWAKAKAETRDSWQDKKKKEEREENNE